MILPNCVQRLPNGHTFVTCRNQLVELDAQQREVWNYPRAQHDIVAAQRLRNGDTVFTTTAGACVRLDTRKTEVKTFQTPRTAYTYGGLDVLGNGRVLITQRSGVAEFEPNGNQVWQAAFNQPVSVQRLPNGNTLVAGSGAATVVELDRNGQPVWDYKAPDGFVPWRAHRR